MQKYDYIFDDEETITVKGKGLKEALRQYRSKHPKQLRANVRSLAKSGIEQSKHVILRELNIGIDRHGNIIR